MAGQEKASHWELSALGAELAINPVIRSSLSEVWRQGAVADLLNISVWPCRQSCVSWQGQGNGWPVWGEDCDLQQSWVQILTPLLQPKAGAPEVRK